MKKRCSGLLVFLLLFILLSSYSYALDNQVYRSTKIWSDESAGTHIFFISSVDIAMTQVSFDTLSDLTDAKMIIEAQKSNPQSLEKVDNTYQYITIGKFGIPDEDIRNIVLQFRVDKSLIPGNPNNTGIILYYFDNTWKPTSITYLFDDQSFYYYKSTPPKLTYYAIALTGNDNLSSKSSTLPTNEGLGKITNASIQKNADNTTITPDFYGLAKNFLSSKKNVYLIIGVLSGIIILLVIFVTFLNLIIKGEYLDNVDDIQKIVDEELSEGVPKREIEREIIKSGWPKRVVNKLVHNERLPHEMEIKIKAYVQKMREKTLPIEQIKTALLKEGWDEEIIDGLIKDFTSS